MFSSNLFIDGKRTAWNFAETLSHDSNEGIELNH